jgi:sugar phosphate permease
MKYIAIPRTVYVLFYLSRMNFPALIPAIIEKYGFTATQMSIAASSLFLAYTLFQRPSGFLRDGVGVRIVLTVGTLLISAGTSS